MIAVRPCSSGARGSGLAPFGRRHRPWPLLLTKRVHQRRSNGQQMRVDFRDVGSLSLTNDKGTDVGMIGQLVQIARNALLPQKG